MKILLICACISLDTNSVIPVILSPATRNHYLFHYILSGTGTLMADNSKGETLIYSVKKRTGVYDFPGADQYLHCR